MFGKLPFHGVSEDELYRNIIKGPLVIPNCTKPTFNLIKGMLLNLKLFINLSTLKLF